VLDPNSSYSNYIYETKITTGLVEHYNAYAKEVEQYFQSERIGLIVDLGSNDGTMLKAFEKLGHNVLGVEPNEDLSQAANNDNLHTINDYFSKKVAKKILEVHGKASVVTANYMFANVDDLINFTKLVETLLDDNGIFVIQTGYHPDQMQMKMFDYIYHEHFSYFTLNVLNKLMKMCGLRVLDVKKHNSKGGSVRVVAAKHNSNRQSSTVLHVILDEEKRAGMDKRETYLQFSRMVTDQKCRVLDTIKSIKAKGQSIVGFGASHSTTTLLHHFQLGAYLDYLVDDNPSKQGLYSPGYHLPVYSPRCMYKENPDYLLLLAWQHSETIVDRHRKILETGAKFILPLPELEIVSS
jgi:SAM-dependent methyltransferase